MRVDPEVRRYLKSLPVIRTGQGDDLVIETEISIPDSVPTRVWVSRTAEADGVGTIVEIEILHDGKWHTYPNGVNAKMMLALALRAAGYAGGGLE